MATNGEKLVKGLAQDIEGLAVKNDESLYTLYAPPSHRDGVVHDTRHDADADNDRGRSRALRPALPVGRAGGQWGSRVNMTSSRFSRARKEEL